MEWNGREEKKLSDAKPSGCCKCTCSKRIKCRTSEQVSIKKNQKQILQTRAEELPISALPDTMRYAVLLKPSAEKKTHVNSDWMGE